MSTLALSTSNLADPRAVRLRVPAMTVRTKGGQLLTDQEQYSRWIAGDIAGFTALYENHNPRLVAFAAKMTDDVALAEDICHRAWEKLIEFRRQGRRVTTPAGLLVRTVRNLAIDHLRRARRSAPFTEVEEVTVQQEASDREQIVLECLDELRPQTREILVLHYYSGYSFDEIATMMDMKPNAVYTRVSRARAELKVLVERRLAALERVGRA